MQGFRSLDALVRTRLRQWPQRPPGLAGPRTGRDGWLRGRPTETTSPCHPFLKLPGSDRLRTLPDGLWLNFGGTALEPFVDILAIEACNSLPNLLDKRSRFAPSTHSLLAVCPVPWLLAPVTANDPTPRWQATGVLRHEPTSQSACRCAMCASCTPEAHPLRWFRRLPGAASARILRADGNPDRRISLRRTRGCRPCSPVHPPARTSSSAAAQPGLYAARRPLPTAPSRRQLQPRPPHHLPRQIGTIGAQPVTRRPRRDRLAAVLNPPEPTAKLIAALGGIAM